ncbi:MAG: GNAT family N-acetyltransferase [Clostridiales bacterium]|nr:GNAT family N-acetyltransferase [Clostridiales bacterium]
MLIRIAELNDLHILKRYDKHIFEAELRNAIKQEHILIAETNGEIVGWLRYNYFWDNTPFLNMLFVLSEHRGKLYGTNLIAYWENQMKLLGFHSVMTSTQANECAQHFYHKLGYNTIGGFMMGNEPYELILSKEI